MTAQCVLSGGITSLCDDIGAAKRTRGDAMLPTYSQIEVARSDRKRRKLDPLAEVTTVPKKSRVKKHKPGSTPTPSLALPTVLVTWPAP